MLKKTRERFEALELKICQAECKHYNVNFIIIDPYGTNMGVEKCAECGKIIKRYIHDRIGFEKAKLEGAKKSLAHHLGKKNYRMQ